MEGRHPESSRFRRWRHRRRVIVGVVLAVVAAGVPAVVGPSAGAASPGGAVASPVARVGAERVDGATLLKGLFCGVGPVAERYPKLVTARVTAENAALVDRLIADAEAREPGFLNRFATGMYSGSHVDIQFAAEDAGRLLRSVVESSAGAADGTAQPGTDYRGMCLAINLSITINLAITINVVVAIALGIIVLFGSEDPSSGSQAGGRPGGLTRDQWVDGVARTL